MDKQELIDSNIMDLHNILRNIVWQDGQNPDDYRYKELSYNYNLWQTAELSDSEYLEYLLDTLGQYNEKLICEARDEAIFDAIVKIV